MVQIGAKNPFGSLYFLSFFSEFKPFGSVQLKKNLDGNYTGDFVSSSFHEIVKSLRDESDKSEERTYKLKSKSGDTFSSNFPVGPAK